MTRIVRTTYRYQRPPRKRQAVALEVPAVVKTADPAKASKQGRGLPPGPATQPPAPAYDDRTPPPPPAASAIVTIRSRKGAMLAHLLEDMTPEEHQRRGDAADALLQEIKRVIAEKLR
jgi:hypothetical protein